MIDSTCVGTIIVFVLFLEQRIWFSGRRWVFISDYTQNVLLRGLWNRKMGESILGSGICSHNFGEQLYLNTFWQTTIFFSSGSFRFNLVYLFSNLHVFVIVMSVCSVQNVIIVSFCVM